MLLIVSGCSSGSDSNGETSAPDLAEVPTPFDIIPPTPTQPPPFTELPNGAAATRGDGNLTVDQAAALDALILPEQGVYGVAATNAQGEFTYTHNADTPFITASTYKLILMADILRRVEAGEFKLEDVMVLKPEVLVNPGGEADTYYEPSRAGGTTSIGEMIYAIATYSSNGAARTLLTLTDPTSLRRTAELAGMEHTYVLADLKTLDWWPPPVGSDTTQAQLDQAIAFVEKEAKAGPVNITTPRDMATYMSGLLTGKTISPYVSEQILSVLLYQKIQDRLPYLLPDDIPVANKPGNLVHVTNDIGIIFTRNGPVPVAALSLDTDYDGRAKEVEQRIGLILSGDLDVPPISDESMIDKTPHAADLGPPDDYSAILSDPPVIAATPAPG